MVIQKTVNQFSYKLLVYYLYLRESLSKQQLPVLTTHNLIEYDRIDEVQFYLVIKVIIRFDSFGINTINLMVLRMGQDGTTLDLICWKKYSRYNSTNKFWTVKPVWIPVQYLDCQSKMGGGGRTTIICNAHSVANTCQTLSKDGQAWGALKQFGAYLKAYHLVLI